MSSSRVFSDLTTTRPDATTTDLVQPTTLPGILVPTTFSNLLQTTAIPEQTNQIDQDLDIELISHSLHHDIIDIETPHAERLAGVPTSPKPETTTILSEEPLEIIRSSVIVSKGRSPLPEIKVPTSLANLLKATAIPEQINQIGQDSNRELISPPAASIIFGTSEENEVEGAVQKLDHSSTQPPQDLDFGSISEAKEISLGVNEIPADLREKHGDLRVLSTQSSLNRNIVL